MSLLRLIETEGAYLRSRSRAACLAAPGPVAILAEKPPSGRHREDAVVTEKTRKVLERGGVYPQIAIFRVEPRGSEPPTSAVQRRRDTLLGLSEACKIPANSCISVLTLFPACQYIYSGCCTVAAPMMRLASAQGPR